MMVILFIGTLCLDFTIDLKVFVLLSYITAAIELFYFSYTGIQFRELGFVYNSLSSGYIDVESFVWLKEDVLVIKKRKGLKKKIKILIKPEDKKRIDEYLEEKFSTS